MVNGWYHRTMHCRIASKTVSDQSGGFTALALDETAEKAFSRMPIAATLDENSNDIAVPIDGAPKILPLPLNRDKQFVQVPRVLQAALSSFEPPDIIRTELLTPLANGFLGHRDAPFRQ